MTDFSEDASRLAIRQTLSRSVGNGSGADALGAAVIGLWEQTAGQLEPVIGARGVDALFGRALHLTARRFPWLPTTSHDNRAASLEALHACLAGRSAPEASDAGETLLLTFTELLASMVGESLTGRLLGAGWTPCDPLAVVKVRDSAHSSEIRQYAITGGRIVIGDPVRGYEGLLGGSPQHATDGPHSAERGAKERA